MSQEVLLARAFLSRVAEPACIPLWALVRDVGPVEAVRQLRDQTCSDVRLRTRTAPRIAQIDPQADLESAQRHGIRLVVPEDDAWPHFALAAFERPASERVARYHEGAVAHADSGEPIPPLALWVRGDLDLASLGVRAVAVVGARSATAYGVRVASDLAYGLALRDFVVVSGGAYGIDAAAHRGALAAGGSTVIVSAGGLDRAYPPAHESLFARAAEHGLILSESPPGSAPKRGRFLTRNRLIAAFSSGSVIVEAAKRSGAINTASHATRLGRALMAVPGPVTSGMSTGCHNLLRSDDRSCALVADVDDVLAQVGGWSDLPGGAEVEPVREPDLRGSIDALDAAARRVYDGLPARREIEIDQLAAACGVSPLEVIRALPALELAQLLERTDSGVRRVATPRSSNRSRNGVTVEPLSGTQTAVARG